jgi:hypothetical protein
VATSDERGKKLWRRMIGHVFYGCSGIEAYPLMVKAWGKFEREAEDELYELGNVVED